MPTIECAVTGTLDMIALCKTAGLKSPEFRQDGGQFVQTLWRPTPQVKLRGSRGRLTEKGRAWVAEGKQTKPCSSPPSLLKSDFFPCAILTRDAASAT